MLLKHSMDVPACEIKRKRFSNMKARFILTAQDGCPRYALRLMEIGPGGRTSLHCHQEEHEMFFLVGKGLVKGEGEYEIPVSAGDALFIKPREYHQIKNQSTITLKLICTVPILPGKDGKNTTPCK